MLKVKMDASDRYAAKSHCRRLPNFNYDICSAISKKCLVFATYMAMTIAIVVLLYWAIRAPAPDLLWWCSTSEGRSRGKNTDSFLLMRDRERASYDRLMHYILHPQAYCVTSKVLGGKTQRNGKLDGDKEICLEPGPGFSKECIVYSFGIADDWSFEDEMHKRFGCSVYSFDPSMGVKDHVHSKDIWFYNLGIGEFDGKVNVNGKEWNMKSFDSILKQIGHRDKTIDLLKLDIEGAEFGVLGDILDKGLLNHVNHLCVEIHLLDKPYWTQFLNLLKRIESEAGLRLFSTRNNTQTPKRLVPGFFARYEKNLFEMSWYRHSEKVHQHKK